MTPTIGMYYYMCFIFIIVNILINQILLLNLQCFSTNFPIYLFFKAIFAPKTLPNSFTIRIVDNQHSTRQLTSKIVLNSCNVGSVISHLAGEFKNILNEVSPPKIIGMIIRGDNLFYVMKNLLNITLVDAKQKQMVVAPNNQESWIGS